MDLSLCIGTTFSSFRREMEEQGPDKSQPLARSGDFSNAKARRVVRVAPSSHSILQTGATPSFGRLACIEPKMARKKACVLEHGACCVGPLSKLDLAHTGASKAARAVPGGGRSISPCTALPMPANKAFSRAAPPEPRPDCSAAGSTFPFAFLSCASVGWRHSRFNSSLPRRYVPTNCHAPRKVQRAGTAISLYGSSTPSKQSG